MKFPVRSSESGQVIIELVNFNHIGMNLKELVSAIEQIADEKGISKERALEAVEAALAAAYKKEYRKRSEVVRTKLNTKTGSIEFWLVKTVVRPDEVRVLEEDEDTETEGQKNRKTERPFGAAQGKPLGAAPAQMARLAPLGWQGKPFDTASINDAIRGRRGRQKDEVEEKEVLLGPDGEPLPRYNPDRHIFLEEALEIKPGVSSGDEIEFSLESHADFGRIAAQTAKQVILQGLREAEKDSIRLEFANKGGEVVSGVVQRFERGNVYVDIGRAVGVMFYNESVPGEHYKTGQRMRFLVLAIQEEDKRRPGIVLSRSHPNFVKKLFEMEVPEIMEGIVEIRAIAREPGNRTKIAVYSLQEGVDPIGAVVGQRGTRVMAVTNELGNEKIDVIEWSEDPEKFIANSLSPAKVKLVEALPRREARVLVQEDQLSLAIGRSGQNVRLAAKLTGWKIDVRSQSRPDEVQEEGVAEAAEEEEAEESFDAAQDRQKDMETEKQEDNRVEENNG